MTEPHAVRLNDLLAAIKVAGDRLQADYAKSSTDTSRVANAGGMYALRELRKALTPERDGAGSHPSEAPPEPAPSPCDHRYAFDNDDPDAVYRCVKCRQPAPFETRTCSCGWIDCPVPGGYVERVMTVLDDHCDLHGYQDRRAAEAGLCGWRHPHWDGVYCTKRADLPHITHSSRDARGWVEWGSARAAKVPGARKASAMWPPWEGDRT